MKSPVPILFFFFVTLQAGAQDSIAKQNNLQVRGYIKDMQSIAFDKDFRNPVSGNLIHNRLNLQWKPSPKFTAVAEFRNRFYWGEQVKQTPNMSSLLRNDNELLDLEYAWIDNGSMILHTNTERAYLHYQGERFSIRAGRQRINWGVTNTWNANDIFNNYNFLDFDYEERPGVDAIRTRYILKDNSSLELAAAGMNKMKSGITALKYAFNRNNYDFQGILGIYKDHFTLGAGWAGYIKDAGFKGEMQYFFASKGKDHLNITVEFDYMLSGGWYINTAALYNNRGRITGLSSLEDLDLELSTENPMPTRWNFMISTAKEINPLLSSQLSVLYAPGTDLVFVLPTLQYNISTNLDLGLIWQSFFGKMEGNFSAINHQCFLRLKWSF